jgi:nucleotide-binding universal stress UspA family protein
MVPLRRLLVAVDFSACSERALDYAAALAARLSASLLLLHVRAKPRSTPQGFTLADPDDLVRIQEGLRDAETRARERGAPHVATKLLDGDAWDQIVELAFEERCDLIVMGTHGRGAVGHLLLGSVAEQVLRHATCAVLTLH